MPISWQYTDVYGLIICYITEQLDPTNYLLNFGIVTHSDNKPHIGHQKCNRMTPAPHWAPKMSHTQWFRSLIGTHNNINDILIYRSLLGHQKCNMVPQWAPQNIIHNTQLLSLCAPGTLRSDQTFGWVQLAGSEGLSHPRCGIFKERANKLQDRTTSIIV